MATNPKFSDGVITVVKQILPADTTDKVVLYTVPASTIAKITDILVSTNATSPTINFYISDGTTDKIFNTHLVPTNSGFATGTLPVTLQNTFTGLFCEVDNQGRRFLQLKAGSIISVAATVTITADKEVNFLVKGEYISV